AAHFEFGEHAAGARHHGDALVGFGATGNYELAAMRDHRRRHDGDTKELLALGVAGANGGVALRRFARQEMAGRDPEAGTGHQTERCDAARFHREPSLWRTAALRGRSLRATSWGRLRNMWRVMSMKIGNTEAGLNCGSSARRHHTPSAMIISMVTTASKSTSPGMSP